MLCKRFLTHIGLMWKPIFSVAHRGIFLVRELDPSGEEMEVVPLHTHLRWRPSLPRGRSPLDAPWLTPGCSHTAYSPLREQSKCGYSWEPCFTIGLGYGKLVASVKWAKIENAWPSHSHIWKSTWHVVSPRLLGLVLKCLQYNHMACLSSLYWIASLEKHRWDVF